MKRDMNLIRKILKSYANGNEPDCIDDNIRHHIFLCHDAGFLVKNNLAMKGFDFLETFGNDTIWNYTCEHIESNNIPRLLENYQNVYNDGKIIYALGHKK